MVDIQSFSKALKATSITKYLTKYFWGQITTKT